MPEAAPGLDLDAARAAVERALAEDLGAGDVTSEALIPAEAGSAGTFVAREAGVLAGMPVVRLVLERVDPAVALEVTVAEGAAFEAGATLARVRGRARSLLAAERVALNFLQRMCGIATVARRLADAVKGTSAAIYDTRKTTPGLRALEKYAVRTGGGRNHRMGLHDAGLVKDNHLAVLAQRAGVAPDEVDLRAAVAAIRARGGGPIFVELEATTLRGVERALEAGPDAILLDNMDVPTLRQAVALVTTRAAERPGGRRPALEASGGVRLDNVKTIADTGVDRISVGMMTHGARALDIALDFEVR